MGELNYDSFVKDRDYEAVEFILRSDTDNIFFLGTRMLKRGVLRLLSKMVYELLLKMIHVELDSDILVWILNPTLWTIRNLVEDIWYIFRGFDIFLVSHVYKKRE